MDRSPEAVVVTGIYAAVCKGTIIWRATLMAFVPKSLWTALHKVSSLRARLMGLAVAAAEARRHASTDTLC